MQTFIKTSDGLRLWTQSFGERENPPVLLIMGAMAQGLFWPDAFCEALAAAGHHVVRYDNRDTGESDKVDFQHHPYDLHTLAADAIDVMHGHGLARATVVGLSMGGYIAQLMAIEHPELVERLVLMSTSADHRPYMAATMGQSTAGFALPGPQRAYLDYIVATANHPPRTPAEAMHSMSEGWKVTYGGSRSYPRSSVEQALQRSVQRSPDLSPSFHHGLAVAASEHRLDLVQRISAPTLVIHGRHDALLPLAHGQYLAAHIPKARLEVLDMGHAFMWSWDREVLALVLSFMQTA